MKADLCGTHTRPTHAPAHQHTMRATAQGWLRATKQQKKKLKNSREKFLDNEILLIELNFAKVGMISGFRIAL